MVYWSCTIIFFFLVCLFLSRENNSLVHGKTEKTKTDLVSFSHVVYMYYFYLFIYLCLVFFPCSLRKYDRETNFSSHLYVNVCTVGISACDAAPVKCADEYAEFSFSTVHKWPSSAGSRGFVNEMEMAFWVDAAALFSGEGERQKLPEPTFILCSHKGSSLDSFESSLFRPSCT